MKKSATQPARVLLIDDDEIDARLTRATLEAARIEMELREANSGESALAYLRDNPRGTDLILLDVRMPGMNGIETLQAIKADPKLAHIPVVMLSSSTSDEDILRSYAEQAQAYMTKPIQVDAFRAIVRRLDGFCFVLSVVSGAVSGVGPR